MSECPNHVDLAADAERKLAGLLLQDGDTAKVVIEAATAGELDPSKAIDQLCGEVFTTVPRMLTEGAEISLPSVISRLGHSHTADLYGFHKGVGSIAHLGHYLTLVREGHARREANEEMNRCISDLQAGASLVEISQRLLAAREVLHIASAGGWPEPRPLPKILAEVKSFDFGLVPASLRPWIEDTAKRLQCSPDYIAVAAMTALGSVIGRKVGIRPQKYTDWTEVPNMWSIIVGRPGLMKSPAMSAALTPLKHLQGQASERYKQAMANFETTSKIAKLRASAAVDKAKNALRRDPHAEIDSDLFGEGEAEPTLTRYKTNDVNYASLGALLQQNPNGILVYRDELVAQLKDMDDPRNASLRGLFLTGWNGGDSYTFDRIERGLNITCEVCLSVLGATQPSKLAAYVKSATKGGEGDDGLMQRFGLMVWPNQMGWVDCDQPPNQKVLAIAIAVFERLAALEPLEAGAREDLIEGRAVGLPYLRFNDAALDRFRPWRKELEEEIRGDDIEPAYESHLAKYRKLIPTLALITHLANGEGGPVTLEALETALDWDSYLRSHARRVYRSGDSAVREAAEAILSALRKGKLATEFVSQDVIRPKWTRLTDKDTVYAALNALVAHDWLRTTRIEPNLGRPKTLFRANPKGLNEARLLVDSR